MSSQSPGKWVGIVGAITLLFGIWIGGASTSRVYCAWYFAVNIDDYIAADFVVDQVEHHGAGKQYEDV